MDLNGGISDSQAVKGDTRGLIAHQKALEAHDMTTVQKLLNDCGKKR